jgi:hypothetical protein
VLWSRRRGTEIEIASPSWSRSRNYELQLRLCLLFIYYRLKEILQKKIIVNCASLILLVKSKQAILKVSYKTTLSGSRGRNSYLQLHGGGVAAESNNFGSLTPTTAVEKGLWVFTLFICLLMKLQFFFQLTGAPENI